MEESHCEDKVVISDIQPYQYPPMGTNSSYSPIKQDSKLLLGGDYSDSDGIVASISEDSGASLPTPHAISWARLKSGGNRKLSELKN
jgi:hypothetical protein